MSIRSRLVVLVLAVIVPAIAIAAWAVHTTYERERSAVERTLRETARALALLVDRELEKRETAALILATSPHLRSGELESFYEQAAEAASAFGGLVSLLGAERQLMNTARPFGAVLPERLGRGLRSHAYVTGLVQGPVTDTPVVEVIVPVYREGQLVANLGVGIFPEQVQRVLLDQGLPPGWTAAVLDQRGFVVARQPAPERWVGRLANEDLRERAARNGEGYFRTQTLDGTPVAAFFSKSPRYGWTFAIGVPEETASASIRRALAEVGVGALALLLAAMVGALWVARGVAASVESLRRAAVAMERGEPVSAQRSGVSESDEVSHAMARASERIRGANEALERRVAQAVAETRAAQDKLLQTQKMDAIGQLTGGIAHDFNNLLQTLATGHQVLARIVVDSRARTVLDACDRAVRKASKLTQQLLAFGRHQPFRLEPVDLRDQVLAIRELLRGALREDIVLSVDLAPDLWPVHVDSTQLELALLNIAFNARDAMPRGGRLRIAARNVRHAAGSGPQGLEGEFVRLRIEDSGEGIPPDVLSRVFDPFFTTKEVGKGSGLGLSQVYAFARQSGGAVELDSEVGRGTAVTLTLPRTRGSVATASGGLDDALPATGANRTVLFVEDDLLVSDVVGSALEGLGFRLLRAHDAEQALAILRSDEHVDVVFSDVVMPGTMNGFDLARMVREMRPDVDVVLATGYTDKESQVDETTVLAKPYTIATLIEALTPRRAAAA